MFLFYLFKEHDEVGQELCEFGLIRRLSQVIKDHVYDGVFVCKIRMSRHQQLCTLLWSQELEDLQLNGKKRTNEAK